MGMLYALKAEQALKKCVSRIAILVQVKSPSKLVFRLWWC